MGALARSKGKWFSTWHRPSVTPLTSGNCASVMAQAVTIGEDENRTLQWLSGGTIVSQTQVAAFLIARGPSAVIALPAYDRPMAEAAIGAPTKAVDSSSTAFRNFLGGADIRDGDLRSGSPGQHSSAELHMHLRDVEHRIQRVSFEYQYVTGYGTGANGANFTFEVVDACGSSGYSQRLYSSPVLTDYPYDVCHRYPDCYSPPAIVTIEDLDISAADALALRFRFDNNDRNLQLHLPLNVTVAWSSGTESQLLLEPHHLEYTGTSCPRIIEGLDPNADPGFPLGPAQVNGSTYTRSYSKADVSLDCASFTSTIALKNSEILV